MAEQRAGSRLGSWFCWTKPASFPQQPQPGQRPPSQPPAASQPQVPSGTQLQPKPPSRSASQLEQTQKESRPFPEPNAQLQSATQTASQPPSPSLTSLAQSTAPTSSRSPSQSRTSPSQKAGQTPSQRPSDPSRTGPQLQTATRAASQPKSSSRATASSQVAARSASRNATRRTAGSQSQSETQATSHSPSPSGPSSASQPASMTKLLSPSQMETKPLTAVSEPPSPSHTASQPQTPTQTLFQPPSPSYITQSQPATKSASQPSSRTASQPQAGKTTASQAVSQSQVSTPSQQSRQRESPLSPPSIKSSKPKSTSSPSTPKSKAPSPKTAEPQPLISQTLLKKTQTIAANSELHLETQTQVQRSPTQDKKAETNSLQAYAENKPTAVATTMPIVDSSPKAALETSPPSEEFTAARHLPKTGEKGEATMNEKLKMDTAANPAEMPKIQRIGQPTDKIDDKLLHSVSGTNTTTTIQAEATTQPMEEMTASRDKQMEHQVLSRNGVATSSKGKTSKTKSSVNRKDGSTKSEKHLRDSTSPGEQATLRQEIKVDVSRFIQKLDAGNRKLLGDEHLVSVITLAGENRGASMNAGADSLNKDNYLYIHRGYKLEKEVEKEVSSDRDDNKSKGKSIHLSGQQPMLTCVNNNVQSINNSLLYNSSCSERNPGVHLNLSLQPTRTIVLKEKMKPQEIQKDQFNITPPPKLKPEPTVRRRCLRGLFMEPSDSDPDNPQKPRRHGCRYRCPEEGKGRDEGK